MNIKVFTFLFILLFGLNCEQHSSMQLHENIKNISEVLIELSEVSKRYFNSPVEFYNSTVACKIDSFDIEYRNRYFTNDSAKVEFITQTVFKKWGITFSNDRNDIQNMTSCGVLENRKGSCLGISLIILLIGESLGLPLYGVNVPGHFFVRYETDSLKINIETMKQGANMPDYWYCDRFIKDEKNYTLKCLNSKNILSLIHYNMGNICLENGSFDKAVKNYRVTLKDMPLFSEGRGNLAIALERSGKIDQALKEMLVIKGSGLKKINHNIASLFLKKKDFLSAKNYFSKAVIDAKNDPEPIYWLAVTEYNLGNLNDAQLLLNTVLLLKPSFADVYFMKEKIQGKFHR